MTEATTFIQWKGTEICMDLKCPCGHRNHYCRDRFAYSVKCAGCGIVYELGTAVTATPTTDQHLVENALEAEP